MIQQLAHSPELQFKYLHALFRVNTRAGQKYHLLQVDLYAKYDPSHLNQFLEQSQSYNIEKAREILENHLPKHTDIEAKNNLYRGIVYLLGRVGNTNQALRLIIDKLQDVELVWIMICI